jgi:glutamate formiminotransferase
MRVLTVPNWSFGRDRRRLGAVRDLLVARDVTVHFADGDVDHNRTVTAFSGPIDLVVDTLMMVSELVLDGVDLNRHVGVHPRIGALDVCPFVLAPETPFAEAEKAVEQFAARFAERFEVPVFLYEKSERGRHEADLPALRKGGFGGLLDRDLTPDFGPTRAHPQWGVTVIGIRDFLIAMNVNLKTADLEAAKTIAKEIRARRAMGDERFLGVRALGFPLALQNCVQVSLNLTLPDLESVDEIIEWVSEAAHDQGTAVRATELIGVIRAKDLEKATRLSVRREQIVEW